MDSKEITLNLFEIVLNKNRVDVNRSPYSKDMFDEYKIKLPDYFFYRFQNYIYALERKQTEQILPDTFENVTITINEHSLVFSKMLEVAITEIFRNFNRDIYKDKYSSIWVLSLKENSKNFSSLELIPTLHFSVNTLYSKKSNRQIIALTVRKLFKPKFNSKEDEIKKQNIDTRDWTRNKAGEIVASSKNRHRYLEAKGLSNQYQNFLDASQSNEEEFKNVQQYLLNFNTLIPRLYLPNGLQVTQFLLVNLPNSTFELSVINRPKYYFFNERTKFGYHYDKLLSEMQPYSYELFLDKKINILVLTPKEFEGTVDEYTIKLKDKLLNIFHLKKVEFFLHTFENNEGYIEKLNEIETNQYNLAIVIVSQNHKSIAIPDAPYYKVKAKLLNQRLPSQDLTIEVIRRSNEFIEKNISLNIYSKIGGTAWTIDKLEKNISELIIGIGSTSDQNANTIIGFANIFDYNGTYLLGDCSQLCTKDDYVDKLANYLTKNLSKAFEQKGISNQDKIRLIFHIYKEASKDYELRAIEKVLNYFGTFSIQVGIIHLSYNHNYRVLANEGKEPPTRGTFIQISSYQALLHLGGRAKVPILVRLDKRSTYIDIYAATKQALHFSHLSHRTFIPPSVPITIKYPSIMAKIIYELQQVVGWDFDILNKLSDRLWFI